MSNFLFTPCIIYTAHLVQYILNTLYNTEGTIVPYTLQALYNTHFTRCTIKSCSLAAQVWSKLFELGSWNYYEQKIFPFIRVLWSLPCATVLPLLLQVPTTFKEMTRSRPSLPKWMQQGMEEKSSSAVILKSY